MSTMGRALTLLLAGLSWTCGDAPTPEQSPPTPNGVYGQAPAAAQGIPSVVTLRPSSGGQAAPPAVTAVLDQLGLAFTPSRLLVHVGQRIEVVNSESLAHNVHITFVDDDAIVLLADMVPGERREVMLDREGGYDVVCDAHPGMRAFIYMTSAPYAVLADTDGRFVIADVPLGSYTASVWSADAGLRSERSVEISGSSTELDLSGSS